MNSLVFLVAMSIKNGFLEILRKPAKLFLYLFLIVMVAGLLVLAHFSTPAEGGALDIVWLKGILFLFILLFVVIGILNGLSNGGVIFDMNDVNLLFVSPVDARKILLYGIVRMARTAFLAGCAILFQGNSLGMGFGIGIGGLLLVLLGFILAVCLMQIISLLIYSYTNGNPGKKLAVKLISVAVFLPLVLYGCVQFVLAGDPLIAMEKMLRSPVFSWTPVAGWASEGAVAFIAGDIGGGFLFFGAVIFAAALLIVYIMSSNPDYYEDVLVATETAFEKKRAAAEGQVNTDTASTRKITVVKTGVGGFGASAVFFKHLRESFRANRLGLWGVPSILTVLGVIIVSLFSKEMGMLLPLQILMWAQMFLIGTGRGMMELTSHYIYMIPEPSFSKIIWSNLEMVFKVLVESIVMFTAAGIIMGDSPLVIAAAIIVYTLYSLLLIGVNYVSLRFTGADMTSGVLLLIYILAVIVILLPGLVAAVIVGVTLETGGVLAGLGILSAWELIAAALCFALSRGILHRCDMPVSKFAK
jgi:hypothetical protein